MSESVSESETNNGFTYAKAGCTGSPLFYVCKTKMLKKRKHKTIVGTIGISLLIMLLFFIFTEAWIHTHDYYGLLKNTNGTLYILKSVLPKKDFLASDGILLKLPYGYAKICSNGAMGFSPFTNTASWIQELNRAYKFVDQLGSNYVWLDKATERLLFVTLKKSGMIDYLIFHTKPIV